VANYTNHHKKVRKAWNSGSFSEASLEELVPKKVLLLTFENKFGA